MSCLVCAWSWPRYGDGDGNDDEGEVLGSAGKGRGALKRCGWNVLREKKMNKKGWRVGDGGRAIESVERRGGHGHRYRHKRARAVE